jgi:hypothetical protein
MADGITDTHFATGPKGEVENIENIPWSDLEAAARDIVRSATEARSKEFVYDSMSSGYDPETGEPRYNYQDYATGEFWIQQGTSQWMNTTTGEVINHDPREVDPTQYQWVVDDYVYFYERWPSYPLAMAQECEEAKFAIQQGEMSALNTAAQIAWNGWVVMRNGTSPSSSWTRSRTRSPTSRPCSTSWPWGCSPTRRC